LTPYGEKPKFMTLMVTQLVSGIWHGLYPGYIMFFAGKSACLYHNLPIIRSVKCWGEFVCGREVDVLRSTVAALSD
jgi:D-alanyl-lipoteichoic acid acyltransferase DltB (MBOAT superfamily)